MGWKCKECGYYNDNRDNTCQNERCSTHASQRTSNHWWKCRCGTYNYENQPWCEKCGKSRDEAVSHGG